MVTVLQKSKQDLSKANVQVVAVSYDKVDVLAKFAKRAKVDFPLLSDSDSKTIEAFGVRNEELKGSRIDGVPFPGTFLVDKKGKIAAKLFHDGYKKRHTANEIIAAAKALDKEAKRADK